MISSRKTSKKFAVFFFTIATIYAGIGTAISAQPSEKYIPPKEAGLDPQSRIALNEVMRRADPNFVNLTPEEMRKSHENLFIPMGLAAKDLVDVEEREIPSSHGDIRIRIYHPRNTGSEKKLPVLVYYHGGGMAVGSLKQYDPIIQRMTQKSGIIIISVDYPLTPENKFPIPVEASHSALLWAYENATSFGGDPDRLAIGGDSAGGNLAAALTQIIRDTGGPRITFQLLIYPAVGTRGHSKSAQMFAEGYVFGNAELAWAYDQYITEPEQINDPRVSPILAKNFSNLPPAFVISTGYEIMRDDIEEYAALLQKAGVPTELHRYETTIHPFLSMAGVIDLGKQAIDECALKLRQAFNLKPIF